ncbi:hypothetical protein [Paraburkholderia heleia]|uniref:hypothetical protein n=1 Tax=Paraburkholderia heleia TaxID=634127 RepID=UPI0005A71227
MARIGGHDSYARLNRRANELARAVRRARIEIISWFAGARRAWSKTRSIVRRRHEDIALDFEGAPNLVEQAWR